MKIAHITTIDLALRYLLLNQLVSLQQAGLEVVGISNPGPDVPAIEAAGIRHIAVPMTRNFTPVADLKSLFELYKVIKREKFSLVHTHTPKPGLLGQLAAKMAGVPIIVNTIHGFYFHDHMPEFWRRFYIATEKIAATCSHSILSVNQEDVQTAIKEGIGSPSLMKYLGGGVDIKELDPQKFRDADWRQKKRGELGIAAQDQVVGFVGRLVREKGVLDLLQAAQIVLPKHPRVKFLIIGPTDPDKADTLTTNPALDYGIAASCIFTGIRTDIPELYALMDMLVLPSYREGLPRVPMEAAAMGLPCVVTDIRGCREIVEQGYNGLLTPLGDIGALATAIISLLEDRELAVRLGSNGRKLATEQFDEQLVFEKVKAEYARLLQARGMSVPSLLASQVAVS